jgi:hypothetical protein
MNRLNIRNCNRRWLGLTGKDVVSRVPGLSNGRLSLYESFKLNLPVDVETALKAFYEGEKALLKERLDKLGEGENPDTVEVDNGSAD